MDSLEKLAIQIILITVIILILFRKTFKKNPILLGAVVGGLIPLGSLLLRIELAFRLTNPIWRYLNLGQAVVLVIIGDILFYALIGALICWFVERLRSHK